ncbi:MAG: PIN domain-containing protein [Myxococcota bacterium]
MRAVDTNVLVRLLAQDDAAQLAAARTFVAQGAWVSHLVLAETVWVLDGVYELDRAKIAAAIEMLLDHASLTLQDEQVVRSALHLYQSRPAVGFTDCLVVELARQAGHLPLGTFDKRLARIDGVERVSP